jgi:hypothetical protein
LIATLQSEESTSPEIVLRVNVYAEYTGIFETSNIGRDGQDELMAGRALNHLEPKKFEVGRNASPPTSSHN